MYNFIVLFLVSLLPLSSIAKSPLWSDIRVAESQYDTGRALSRVQFVSYDIREEAEKADLANATFYVPLSDRYSLTKFENGTKAGYSMEINIPFAWLDRELFFHVGGLAEFSLFINDKFVGRAHGSHVPAEFNISQAVTNGINSIRIEAENSGYGAALESTPVAMNSVKPDFYIYSQPKVRIENFVVAGLPDSLGKHGELRLGIAVANSYNSSEAITVGYDIYSPAGKLLYYDMKNVTLKGNSRDTVQITEPVYGLMQNLWSASSPALYKLMLFVRINGRIIEYIPYKIGFGTTTWNREGIIRNGKTIDMHAAAYNAIATPKEALSDLKALKLRGINTICVDFPQQDWFYSQCEELGLYVIEQSDLNCSYGSGNLNIGGTPGNDPAWLPIFLKRTEAAFERNRNRSCIIAWSIGGTGLKGYNMYKCYQWLKDADPTRPVLFRDAAGDWNSDLSYPAARPASEILKEPLAAPANKPATKPSVRR